MKILHIVTFGKQQNNLASVVLNACINKRNRKAENQSAEHPSQKASEWDSEIDGRGNRIQLFGFGSGLGVRRPPAKQWLQNSPGPCVAASASGEEKKAHGKQPPFLSTLA